MPTKRKPATKQKSSSTKKDAPAWVVTLQMGLGHMRAAYPLADLAHNGIVLYGTEKTCDPKELAIWRRLLKIYYFLSNAKKIPLVGNSLQGYLDKLLEIAPAYPRTDRSKSDSTVNMVNRFIKMGLCRNFLEHVKKEPLPVVSTYFATGLAVDMYFNHLPNYVVITDTDITRSWVPKSGKDTKIVFCSPCRAVTHRLHSYGVHPDKVKQTGFPLPKGNIGSEANAEILKADLAKRLVRLDPNGTFYHSMKEVVKTTLKKDLPHPQKRKKEPVTIMFAIGGAGAQFELVEAMLPAFKSKLLSGEMNYMISCGTSEVNVKRFNKAVIDLGLGHLLGKTMNTVFDKDPLKYFENFNQALRNVDILWTKPSELVFYAGLALPILCAPCIGPHEHLNQEWATHLGAGIAMAGDAKHADQWLFDMIEEGRFARAAWNGFMHAPRNGTFNVERLVKNGEM